MGWKLLLPSEHMFHGIGKKDVNMKNLTRQMFVHFGFLKSSLTSFSKMTSWKFCS